MQYREYRVKSDVVLTKETKKVLKSLGFQIRGQSVVGLGEDFEIATSCSEAAVHAIGLKYFDGEYTML